jgi:lactoylglutathione lyase
MIDTIGGIVIMVSDQQKALDFYTNKLGFDVRSNMEFRDVRWIGVAPKSSTSTVSFMIPNPDIDV